LYFSLKSNGGEKYFVIELGKKYNLLAISAAIYNRNTKSGKIKAKKEAVFL